jgi:hypothetical protein
MNVAQIVAQLRQEHESLSEAIAVLERIAGSRQRRRGRPPAWLSGTDGSTPKRTMSAATRKKMAQAQRKRWAAKRKAQES